MTTSSEKNPEGNSFPIDKVNKSQDETDPLSDLFSSSLSAIDSSNRISQYKCRIREETNQESRRKYILQQQRENRSLKFNERRKNLNVEKDNGSGDWFDEEIFIEEDHLDDEMEWSSIKKVAWHKRGRLFRNMLMFSEWFKEIPGDLTEKWIIVPCPVGKRSFIVSEQVKTISFTKKGIAVCYFKSSLPPRTILDCIWCPETKNFYILDVIQWNGMSLKNCQTEFRFYWLDTKFQENLEYSVKSDGNNYPLLKLPRCICSVNGISSMMNSYPLFPNNSPKLDGLLFYHCEAHYTSGYTPLVGWLKAFMLPDALGISVCSEYDKQKPEQYSNFRQFVDEKDIKRKEYWASKKLLRKSKMDCDENSGDFEPHDQTSEIETLDVVNYSLDIDEDSNCAGYLMENDQ